MSSKLFDKCFRIDFHEYRDFIYNWGIDSGLPLCELSNIVYHLIEQYLNTSLVFLPYGAKSPSPHFITFNLNFGWKVESSEGCCYLGEIIPSKSSSIHVGASTYLSGINHIWGNGVLHIGSYCAIGSGNVFYTCDDSHPSKNLIPINLVCNKRIESFGLNFLEPDYSSYHASLKPDSVKINNGVWIGRNCILKQSSQLDNGVYLGEGSWVNKRLSAYSLYCGTPARLIRPRFTNHVMNKLEALHWWSYSPFEIKANDYLRRLFQEDLDRHIFSDYWENP